MEKLDVPQGTLDLMILTILTREPMHGYGISQRLARSATTASRSIPDRCSRRSTGWSRTASSRPSGGPSENNRNAKYYRLTAAGRKQLEQHRERWDRVAFAITSVLEGA